MDILADLIDNLRMVTDRPKENREQTQPVIVKTPHSRASLTRAFDPNVVPDHRSDAAPPRVAIIGTEQEKIDSADAGNEQGGRVSEHEEAPGQQESVAEQDLRRALDLLRTSRDSIEQVKPQWPSIAEVTGTDSELLDDAQDFIDRAVVHTESLITAGGTNQQSSRVLGALNSVAAAEDLTAEAEAAAITSNADNWIIKLIKAARVKLKGALHRLLSMISHLLTPTGWTLTGGVNIPGLAQATISINFGEPRSP